MPSILQLLQRQDPGPMAAMNFPDTDDKRSDIIAACVVGTVLAVLSTLGRIAARHRTKAPFRADDWLIIFGLVMAVGVVVSTLIMVHFGLGRHINKVTSPQGLVLSVVSSQILYSLSVVPIKLSILYLYHRLFPSPNLRKVALAIGLLTILYSVAQAFLMGLQCTPLEILWNPSAEGTCLNMSPVYTSMAILNVATDCAILTLPIPYIWRLSLQQARKIQLMAVFMTGSAVIAFGIIRAVNVGSASPDDQSWSDVPAAMWSVLEICVGVVSANLPCLRPLFFWLPSAIRGSTGGTANVQAKAYGPGVGGVKRQSTHGHTYEMARRSRIIGASKSAGWESLDDSQPLSRDSDESLKGNRISVTEAQIESHGRSIQSHTPPRAIVVSTTIETSFEARNDHRV